MFHVTGTIFDLFLLLDETSTAIMLTQRASAVFADGSKFDSVIVEPQMSISCRFAATVLSLSCLSGKLIRQKW